ncbi:uncharacterized protein AFUA_8G02540 [Aspergillus fumigatus Af293]|uniref:Uncharacterized protein n=2 Tax=Aspergillus fumigatus TaxID=746128 RepID=Q4WBJ8_ASPFU|nr:hypothetical protein AFUA_8G02540 [Aspergillus fumigatus Af293]EAL84914.1 hypothetical protein AFUA_8G02540 [Aspergillus fumigatus Af293]EDP48955.1 hypothetical protein AFUB_084040 [Aspergillus fumigatus A1163]
MGMSGRELIEAKDKWEKLAMGARPFHVVCDSIEALEDRSRDGDILGGWAGGGTMVVAWLGLGWGLAGKLECNLTAWLSENRPMNRGTGYQTIRGLAACQ